MNIRVLGIVALLSTFSLLPSQTVRAVTTEALSCTPEYQIVQTFSNQAKWEMCWEPRAGYGYRLNQVIFTPPNGIRRKILHSLHVAQLFVPYDDNGARYHDISYGTNLAVLSAAECPAGSLLTNSTLCLVHRPAGYLFKNVSAGVSAQGDSFAVFGYYGVGQYYYVFQYTFFDDGSIEPGVIASGALQRYNANSTSTTWPVAGQRAVNHNHNVIWRMDFDLNGSANNSVERINFADPSLPASSDQRNMTIIPLTTETKETNNLTNATFWRVRNTVENNADGRSISYEIEPNVTDQLRAPEDFTQYDFYLTQYRSTEELVDNGLVGYVNGEAVTDVVLWYQVNFHHVPRGEDDVRMPAHKQGFRIRPRDVTITSAVNPVNHPPAVTNPGAQTTAVSTSVNLQIMATDADGDTLSYSASGLPTGLSINPGTGLISGTTSATAGSFTATVTVSDGHSGGTASTSFGWTVAAAGGSGTQTFSAPGAITINDNAPAAPYPAIVNVSGMSGTISKMVVTLKGLTHTYPADLDVLLVGPGGQKVMLMSDAGAGADISNATITFDAAAAVAVPQSTVITTGSYRPTDYALGSTDSFPAPGPAAPYPADLAVVNGTSPNGDWKLFVLDDAGADAGQLANGFTLTITTGTTSGNTPPAVTNPGAQTTAVSTSVNLQIMATDADGDTLSYSASGLPTGLSINPGTGLISGTTSATAGSFTATVTVSDGHSGGTASTSFGWTVAAAGGSGTQTFSAPGAITINDNAPAAPYPAIVNVSGMSGTISKMVVTLKGLTHTYPADLDVLLVGPGGQKVMLMSDAGAGADISNATITFDAAAAVAVPQSTVITTGSYRPTDYALGSTDSFPAPGPAAPYPADLAVVNGTSPNGDWKLFVLDDAGADAGQLANGFTLTITAQ
ncbi:putative Ig domain-containing protein [Candidatus Methylobacter favarea]|uniref:putative Ig domain-containing protein n=1 Tax=Candidatus Methylobacter favarea TaxID=2707345 RepID=UPI001C2D0F14|nr:putative Ig domain-containing protein [Candidatus Methylobacter favarea]